MSGNLPNLAVRRLAVLGLVAALAVCAAPAMSQAPGVTYPPSRALGAIAAWLQNDTPISPGQVVDISPSALTAVTSAAPMGETRGFLANISSEVVDPDVAAREGIAGLTLPVEVDCERRSARLGTMTGYRGRDLTSDPQVIRTADTTWVSPTPNAPLGAVIRALCDRDFQRPLVGRVKVAAKAPEPVRPAPVREAARPAALRPTLPPAPAPTVTPRAVATSGAVAVQVGASPSLPDIQGLLARFRKKFAGDLDGLATSVATVPVAGKTVNRALVSGFGSAAEANGFCKKLTAAGQACFIRR